MRLHQRGSTALMSRELYLFALVFGLSLSMLLVLVVYLSYFESKEKRLSEKLSFVAFVGLPDLAITNEPYLRHRSLSSVYSVYPVDGALREYKKESFTLTKGVK